jgi:glycosyltransferase involved in cell wall biosynthesis
LGDRVRFLGHREDVPNLMSAADIFVFPSLYEGLGGALIEAMALELPIVASDLESIREVVTEGQNAELVPARSPRLLASAVETLMRDGSKRALYGRRGREIFERRFTLERSATAVAALLRGVATDTSLYRRRR